MSWLGEEAGVEIMNIVESFCLVTSCLCRALLELEGTWTPREHAFLRSSRGTEVLWVQAFLTEGSVRK